MTEDLKRIAARLNTMQHHLDVTYSVLQVKLLWLHRIMGSNDSYRVQITDPTDPPRHVLWIVASAAQLKAHHDALLSDIRRSFVNDLYLCVARDGVIARNIIEGVEPPEPEFHRQAHEGEITALLPFISKEHRPFIEFFRRIRNSAVHYDGSHNTRNALDYVFNRSHFLTTDENIGTQIQYWISDLIAMYNELKVAFRSEDILSNPHLRRLLERRA